MNLLDLSNLLADASNNHPLVNAHYTHSLDEVDIDKVTTDRYPFVYTQVTSSTISESEVTYEFDIVVADIVFEEMEQEMTQVHNRTHGIASDLIASFAFAFNADSAAEGNYRLDLPIRLQPFRARFGNITAGWEASITVRVPAPVNLCDALR